MAVQLTDEHKRVLTDIANRGLLITWRYLSPSPSYADDGANMPDADWKIAQSLWEDKTEQVWLPHGYTKFHRTVMRGLFECEEWGFVREDGQEIITNQKLSIRVSMPLSASSPSDLPPRRTSYSATREGWEQFAADHPITKTISEQFDSPGKWHVNEYRVSDWLTEETVENTEYFVSVRYLLTESACAAIGVDYADALANAPAIVVDDDEDDE